MFHFVWFRWFFFFCGKNDLDNGEGGIAKEERDGALDLEDFDADSVGGGPEVGRLRETTSMASFSFSLFVTACVQPCLENDVENHKNKVNERQYSSPLLYNVQAASTAIPGHCSVLNPYILNSVAYTRCSHSIMPSDWPHQRQNKREVNLSTGIPVYVHLPPRIYLYLGHALLLRLAEVRSSGRKLYPQSGACLSGIFSPCECSDSR